MIKLLPAFSIVFLECKSGRWLAYYQKRKDIIANGDTKKEAEDNLKSLYKSAMDYELHETVMNIGYTQRVRPFRVKWKFIARISRSTKRLKRRLLIRKIMEKYD